MARSFEELANRSKAGWSDGAHRVYEAASKQFITEMEERAPLGAQVAEARKAHHLTQEALSALTGIQRAEISRIERGASDPTAGSHEPSQGVTNFSSGPAYPRRRHATPGAPRRRGPMSTFASEPEQRNRNGPVRRPGHFDLVAGAGFDSPTAPPDAAAPRPWPRAVVGPRVGLRPNQRNKMRMARSEDRAILIWLRGQDLNLRPLGYEPSELPNCSTPRRWLRCLHSEKP